MQLGRGDPPRRHISPPPVISPPRITATWSTLNGASPKHPIQMKNARTAARYTAFAAIDHSIHDPHSAASPSNKRNNP